jgi:hypothetical protein
VMYSLECGEWGEPTSRPPTSISTRSIDRFLKPGTLSCNDAPFDENPKDVCFGAVVAVNDCCHGGGGGGSKCEGDGTDCRDRRCLNPDEVSICIDGQSVCCDPTSPGGGGGGSTCENDGTCKEIILCKDPEVFACTNGTSFCCDPTTPGGGNSCDPNLKIICNTNTLCPAGTMLHRCDPGDGGNCMGSISYQCVETGGGGGNCDPPDLCAVCGKDTPICVDCDNDGCCESCTS